MSSDRVPPGEHVGDGVLLALHDGESVESAEVLPHLHACRECRARLERIHADAELVKAALEAVTLPARDFAPLRRRLDERRGLSSGISPRWRRPAIQIVAALAVATAAAASVVPIRTLLGRRGAGERVPKEPESRVSPPTPHPGTMVSFTEAGPIFTIRFDSTPAA